MMALGVWVFDGYEQVFSRKSEENDLRDIQDDHPGFTCLPPRSPPKKSWSFEKHVHFYIPTKKKTKSQKI